MESDQAIPGHILTQMEQVGPTKVVDGKGKILHIKTGVPGKAVKDLMKTMQHSDTHIRSIEILDANLESVFLHLTGRSLRD